jgi:hypothetical protein
MKRCSKCKRKVDYVTKRHGFQLCDSCLHGLAAPRFGYTPPSLGAVIAEVLLMAGGASQSQKDVAKGRSL